MPACSGPPSNSNIKRTGGTRRTFQGLESGFGTSNGVLPQKVHGASFLRYSRTSIIRTSIIRTFSLVPILSWIFISHDQDP